MSATKEEFHLPDGREVVGLHFSRPVENGHFGGITVRNPDGSTEWMLVRVRLELS